MTDTTTGQFDTATGKKDGIIGQLNILNVAAFNHVVITISKNGVPNQVALDDLDNFLNIKLCDKLIHASGQAFEGGYVYQALSYPGQPAAPINSDELYAVIAGHIREWIDEGKQKYKLGYIPLENYLGAKPEVHVE